MATKYVLSLMTGNREFIPCGIFSSEKKAQAFFDEQEIKYRLTTEEKTHHHFQIEILWRTKPRPSRRIIEVYGYSITPVEIFS